MGYGPFDYAQGSYAGLLSGVEAACCFFFLMADPSTDANPGPFDCAQGAYAGLLSLVEVALRMFCLMADGSTALTGPVFFRDADPSTSLRDPETLLRESMIALRGAK